MKAHETKSLFVAWVYELIRDHVPSGTIEKIMGHTPPKALGYTLANGYIGEYAEDIRQRLEIPDGRFNLRHAVTVNAAWVMGVDRSQVVIEKLDSPNGQHVFYIHTDGDGRVPPCGHESETEEGALLNALVALTNYWARKSK